MVEVLTRKEHLLPRNQPVNLNLRLAETAKNCQTLEETRELPKKLNLNASTVLMPLLSPRTTTAKRTLSRRLTYFLRRLPLPRSLRKSTMMLQVKLSMNSKKPKMITLS